ncbi:MAG: hypothetical protein PVI35_06055 [Acidimicrobiia bacterium]|jgi:hypothetical protein
MEPEYSPGAAERIAQLRAEVRRYQVRYGALEGTDEVLAAEKAFLVRQRRSAWLVGEAERAAAEARSAQAEVERLEAWIEYCLEEIVTRERRAHAEGWSPVPVMGFRVWAVTLEGLNGVRERWRTRTMAATCRHRPDDGEIPHSDGGCGRLGCGVYAAKSLDDLLDGFDVAEIGDVALGMVELTGKVIEHETGYRGAVATVVALAAECDGHLLLSSDPTRIDRVFARPAVIKTAPEVEAPRRLEEMETYIRQRARRNTPWTLASSSG